MAIDMRKICIWFIRHMRGVYGKKVEFHLFYMQTLDFSASVKFGQENTKSINHDAGIQQYSTFDIPARRPNPRRKLER